MTRHRLPATRNGRTHKIRVDGVTLYLTVNVDEAGAAREMFVKCDEGLQGWCDILAETASLYLQRGGDLVELMRHWRGARFDPQGVGASSIPDAIARRVVNDDGELREDAT